MFKNAKINLLVASLLSFAANAADLTTSDIEVISGTPLPSVGINIKQLPSQIQTVKSRDIEKSQSLDATDFMNQNLSGVYINEMQGNPLQPDVTYHGYVASPILGNFQGMSVYVDGVRWNEPFGDVVNWAAIPRNAISGMQLYSGSNPLFGLNTLGGALSIQTKDGRNSPGGAIQFTTGSFGRKIGEFEYGGVSKDNSVDYFFAASWLDEDGWRDRSASNNKNIFTKIGWRGEKTDLKLTYSFTDSDLNGNGTSPTSMLAGNREKVYSWPDNTKNRTHFANLEWSRYFKDESVLSGNAYIRNIRTKTINGDVNDSAFPPIDTNILNANSSLAAGASSISSYQRLGQVIYRNAPFINVHNIPGWNTSDTVSAQNTRLANARAGSVAGLTGNGAAEPNAWRTGGVSSGAFRSFYVLPTDSTLATLITQNEANRLAQCTRTLADNWGSSSTGEPAEKCTGLLNRSKTDQDNFGLSTQFSAKNKLFSLPNTYLVGGGIDYTQIKYKFSQEIGTLLDNGTIQGSGIFSNYSINGKYDTNGEPWDNNVDFKSTTTHLGLFASDTLDVTEKLALTASARYNNSRIDNKDQYGMHQNGSGDDYGTNLTSFHVYQRLNPAIGLAFNPNKTTKFYANYNEGTRTPTSMELGCSDPAHPCKLPSAMASDPELKQVVAKTWEFGTSFMPTSTTLVNANLFDITNQNDIQFMGVATNNNGYFSNIGQTERKGIDLAFAQEIGSFILSGNYTYMDATYESNFDVISNANSAGIVGCNSQNIDGCGTTGTKTNTSNSGIAMIYDNNNEYFKTISVTKGNRMTLIPRNMLKLALTYRVNDKFIVSANTYTASNSLLRGNENGLDSRGIIGGYTTLNLSASYKLASDWTFFGKINNALDKDYATGGQLAMNGLDANGQPRVAYGGYSACSATSTSVCDYAFAYSYAASEAFVAPGAPRAAWIGIRYEFGGKKSSSVDKD